MKYEANINVQNSPPDKEYGWYIAKYMSKKHNRFLFVRTKEEVVVLSDNSELVQLYSLKTARHLYKDWQPINKMKIEVS